jgi:hypothetical protein
MISVYLFQRQDPPIKRAVLRPEFSRVFRMAGLNLPARLGLVSKLLQRLVLS